MRPSAVVAVCPAWVLNPIFFVWAPTAEAVCRAQSGPGISNVDWPGVGATIKGRYRDDLLTVICNAYCLWVPVNLMNFSLTPPHLRIVVVTSVSTFWNCYLSLLQHK